MLLPKSLSACVWQCNESYFQYIKTQYYIAGEYATQYYKVLSIGKGWHTMRYYENLGLIADENVKTNNYKNYDEKVAE